MYEAVTALPEGQSTVARMAVTAAEYGYDGIVVRNAGDRLPGYDSEQIHEEYGLDVVDGVEITAEDPSRASGFLGSHRPERTVVALRGGTDALNRFAVEQPAVDVLARPFGYGGQEGDRSDGGGGTADVDHVLAKTAAENGVRIEFSFGPVLGDRGGYRVRAIQSLRKLRELVRQYDVPYVVTAGAGNHLELRGPRELRALGTVVGFTETEVEAGLSEWRRLAERNRERHSDSFVEPGVWRQTDE